MHEVMLAILLRFINARFRIGSLFTINYSLIAVPVAIAVYCWPDLRLFCGLMSFCMGIGASLLFHEMCHAWMGHLLGYRVREIGLLPIGGYTLFKKCLGTHWADLCISLAGPLGNGMICIGLVALEIGLLDGDIMSRMRQTVAQLYGDDATIEGLPFLVVWANAVLRINLILLIFNLIPAFPLDGGRALIIIVSRLWTERHAGVITMWVSRTIASGVAVYTLVDAIVGTGSPIDILISLPMSLLIWSMSRMEVASLLPKANTGSEEVCAIVKRSKSDSPANTKVPLACAKYTAAVQ